MDITTDKLVSAFSHGFHRFGTIVFIVLIAIAFGIVALSLLGVTQKALDSDASTAIQASNFDTKTIDRLGELTPSTSIVPPEPAPTGQRTNPFTE